MHNVCGRCKWTPVESTQHLLYSPKSRNDHAFDCPWLQFVESIVLTADLQC